MSTNIFALKTIALSLVCVTVFALPSTAAASYHSSVSTDFNGMTTEQKVAYLYGMITQLQLMLQIQQGIEDDDRIGVVRPGGRIDRSDVDVDTLSATDIEDDEAELRARIDLNREDEALVWFEYGEDDDDLDERTFKRRVTDSRGDIQTVSITVDDLDEDERYYYRAVVEDEDRDRSYGSVRSFTTDDDRYFSSRNSNFSLGVDDRSIEAGDEVEVDWEVPSRDVGSRNWIGLYEIGDDNDEYVKWSYIANDDEGTKEFQIYDEGTYEFRLFLDNSYDDEITSSSVVVR